MVNFMKQILATKRLFLREMGQEDYSDLSSLLQDRAVMYAYEHDFTAEDVQEWLDRQLRRYREDGYGLWAMILRETGEFIGQAGLTRQDAAGEEVLEIGYLLKACFLASGLCLRSHGSLQRICLSDYACAESLQHHQGRQYRFSEGSQKGLGMKR